MKADQAWVECVTGCGRRFLVSWLPYYDGKCSCGGDTAPFDMKAEIKSATESYDLGVKHGLAQKPRR